MQQLNERPLPFNLNDKFLGNIYMRSLLLSSQVKIPEQDRSKNLANGSDSESYAMAKLVLACRGEGQWGSREEDNSKIDLIFSAQHPWYPNERMLVLSQVKSGPTYGESRENGFKLTGRAKSSARRTSHGICVVWVDRDKNQTYWAYVHPDASSRPQEYGSQHQVSPTTIFDLARCMALKRHGATGAKGIILRKRASSLADRRKRIKTIYRNFEKIKSPILGNIELTRLGWRHMLRSGRLAQNKATSLDLIPYLKKLLERWPSTHAITSSKYFKSGGYLYRTCEYLLKFEGLTVSAAEGMLRPNFVAYVRLIEEIRYPVDWESQVMLSQLVSRRVVLKSVYYKDKQ